MTPLQLGALVSAIANGGTLYYLQHPTTQADVAAFEPKVKRLLDIKGVIPEILPGMQGAVDFQQWNGAELADELRAVSGVREDRDLLEQRDAVWMVCELCGRADGADRYGDLSEWQRGRSLDRRRRS